ncbi:MAG: alpha/beta hydrolase [Syntrophomonadaceae bacterium]|nr:alpha/beta hydrolase [Syntrophomonadaceae bacterium]
MLSWKARMWLFLMQNRNLLRLRPKHEKTDWDSFEAIERFRQDVESGAARFGKIPEGIVVESVAIGRMKGEWISPAGTSREQAILYFHGGGYVSGTCQAHRGIVAKFAGKSGIPALLFEYRLAPENPYPAALDDALAAYGWLLVQGIFPQNIVFAGDSAGAGLALGTLLALRDKKVPLPAGAAVLSPVTDHTCSGESYASNARLCLSPEGMGPACARHYAGGADLRTPYLSPLFGDLHGLPPLLIYAGGNETLRDDAVRFAAKAEAVGVNTRLVVGQGLFHCYPAMAPLFPEAEAALEDISKFIRTQLRLQNG